MGSIKDKAMEVVIKQAIKKVKENPEENLPKVVDIVKKYDKDNMWEKQYEFLDKVTRDKNNNWNKYINNILEDIDDDIIEKFLCNFIINSAIKGISKNHEVKAKEGCGAPWAIVMDPTTACNMQCTGCWAADYGKSLNLGFDLMDKIVTEGKEIGYYWYLFTGGEPLVKNEEQIQEILDNCEIKPTVLQTEAHPYYPQTEMKNFLSKNDIKIQAWYPLGHGDSGLINEPIFTELAEKYEKSNVQIILRWHIQENNIVIPGAKKEEHIKANIDIFDFELTEDEMNKIAEINKNKKYYESTPELLKGYAQMKPDLDGQK